MKNFIYISSKENRKSRGCVLKIPNPGVWLGGRKHKAKTKVKITPPKNKSSKDMPSI